MYACGDVIFRCFKARFLISDSILLRSFPGFMVPRLVWHADIVPAKDTVVPGGKHQMFGMPLPAALGWRSERVFSVHSQDFCDKVWKNSIGRKEAAFFQKRALPLSLLAASALGDLDVLKTSELIVHCFLDGNIAPFSDPHDWSTWTHAPARWC